MPILFLVLLLLVASLPATAAADPLPLPVAAALARHGGDAAGLSVYVQAVDADKPLLAFNDGVPRRPASIIKLLTTYAGLDVLGPAWRWRTEAWISGDLEGGRLEGDLILRGGGDPSLSLERFWSLLRSLRTTGVETIAGDLVVDRSVFAPEGEDPAAFDGQPYRTYNVPPEALLVNFKAAEFRVRATRNDKIEVRLEPELAGFTIENHVRPARGACGGFQRGVAFDLPQGFTGRTAVLSGNFPVACGQYSLWRTVLDGPGFAYAVFRPLWTGLGGQLEGGLRIGEVPGTARRLLVSESPPLGEVVQQINKWSNNVMARHLMLTLGMEKFGVPATREKGRGAIEEWLASAGLDFPELHLDNGSGLSRATRMSARSMGRMLIHAWSHRFMPEFVASMPLSGMDGTLRRRYGGAMEGRMHLKTGRLDDVSSIAGYVFAPDGRRYVVVVIQNSPGAHRGAGEAVQDAVLKWLLAR